MNPYGVALVAGLFVLTGCSEADEPPPAVPVAPRTSSTPPAPEKTVPTSPAPTPSGEVQRILRFDGGRALADVRHLAGGIGPRLATGPAFREAARWVESRFLDLDYDVTRQTYPVPAGTSWDVPVDAGTSVNVVATPPDFDPRAVYYVVGAHLDTVALAPGAEDNASGVAVLLETARVARAAALTQVVFVAFGGEEPRGPGDLHHFGSKRYVAALSPAERRHLRAMVSLDRVGVGPPLTVGWVAGTVPGVRDALLRTAARIGVRTAIEENTGSDHESFADAGLPAARLGGTAYAAYHSAQDVPAVVGQAQLGRAGAVLWSWLSARAR